MKWNVAFSAAALVFASNVSEASMNGRTYDAEILDPRVVRCGVSVEGDSLATIRPFIETSANLSGRMQIRVSSKSGSNTNVSMQTVGFPGNNVIQVGRPSSMQIEMTASADGKELCRLVQSIDFESTRT